MSSSRQREFLRNLAVDCEKFVRELQQKGYPIDYHGLDADDFFTGEPYLSLTFELNEDWYWAMKESE